MNLTRNWKIALVASIALAAVFALTGHSLVSPESIGALGMLPFALGEVDIPGLADLLKKQGTAFEEFKKANDERLKSIESKGYAPADLEGKVNKINDDLTELGKQIADVAKKSRPGAGGSDLSPEKAEHKSAFDRYARKGEEGNLHELEKKALQTGSDPDGGYLVPAEMETALDRVAMATVAMRRLATVRPIGAASYKKPIITAGMTGGWIGETEDSAETINPKFGELEFPAHKMYAEPWATNDMLEDSVMDLEAWLSEESSITFTELEGAAFVAGTGVKKPRGLLSYDVVANSSYAWGKLGYIASGGAGAWAASNPSDKLFDVVHSLKRAYRNGAAWLMNDLTLASVRKFKDSTGEYLWQPGLQAGIADTLLGYPVETDDNMPDIAANSLSLAFGNFKRGYVIVDRRGVAVIRDNVTKKGYTKFHMTKRVGGGVQNFEAIKLMKFATS